MATGGRRAAAVCLLLVLLALGVAMIDREFTYFLGNNQDADESMLYAAKSTSRGTNHEAIAMNEIAALRADISALRRRPPPPPPSTNQKAPPPPPQQQQQRHRHFGSTCADLKALEAWSKAHASYSSFATLWLRACRIGLHVFSQHHVRDTQRTLPRLVDRVFAGKSVAARESVYSSKCPLPLRKGSRPVVILQRTFLD